MNRRLIRSALHTLLAVLLVLPPAVAATPEEITQARQYSQSGAEAFRAGSYDAALQAFIEANRLVPHPNLDVNIGRTYEKLSQPDQALLHCKIALNAPGVPEPTRQAAQQCVERAQKLLVRPVVTVASRPEAATVRVDGKIVGNTPWRGEVEPGRRQIDIELPGFAPSSRTLNAERGDVYPIDVRLNPAKIGGLISVNSVPAGAKVLLDGDEIGATPLKGFQLEARSYQLELSAPGYAPEISTITIMDGKQLERVVTLVPIGGVVEPAGPLPRWPGWAMVGASAVGVTLGTIYGVGALSAHDKALEIQRTSGSPEDKAEYDKYLGRMEDDRTLSDVFFITGGVLLAGGVTWLLWPDPEATAPEKPSAGLPEDTPSDD